LANIVIECLRMLDIGFREDGAIAVQIAETVCPDVLLS
jgi:hypothetical protein